MSNTGDYVCNVMCYNVQLPGKVGNTASNTGNYTMHMQKNTLQSNTIARKYAILVGNAGVCVVSFTNPLASGSEVGNLSRVCAA